MFIDFLKKFQVVIAILHCNDDEKNIMIYDD